MPRSGASQLESLPGTSSLPVKSRWTKGGIRSGSVRVRCLRLCGAGSAVLRLSRAHKRHARNARISRRGHARRERRGEGLRVSNGAESH
jgi:hypothetical protein